MDAQKVGRDGRWALGLLALAILVTFAEGFVGRVPTMRDWVGFTFPSRAAFRAVLTGGDLSSWNPLAELGLSRLAAPVHGALYPGHLLLGVFELEIAVVGTWLLHVAGATLGGYALARAMGVRPLAAVVSGAAWGVGGYAVSMWWNGEKVLTDVWLPWFAAGVLAATRARPLVSWASIGAAASAAMIVYAGDPFLLFHAMALALAASLACDPHVALGSRAAAVAKGVLPAVFGVGLAAPALVPALFMRGDTPRAEPLARSMAEAWSLHPARIAEFFVPGWFGSPFDVEHYPGGPFADDPSRQVLPWAVSIYLGAAVLVFAPCVRSRRMLVVLGTASAFFVLLALGRHTPLSSLVCRVLPGFSLFRYPEKHVVVVAGLLAMLASRGVDDALSKPPSLVRLALPPFTILALALVFTPASIDSAVRGAVLHAGVFAAALVGLVSVARARSWAPLALGLVAVLDLALAARPFLHFAPRPFFVSPFAEKLRERTHERGTGATFAENLGSGGVEPPPASVFPPRIYRPRSADFEDPSTLPGSAAQVFGWGAFPGHDPASSVRVTALSRVLAADPKRLAQLLALDAMVLPADARVPMPAAASLHGSSLYFLPVSPRAWMAASVRVVRSNEALGAIAAAEFDPYGEVVLAGGGDIEVPDLAGKSPGSAGTCRTVYFDRARVELECDAQETGMVVLSELFAEGWSVAVDGHDERLYAADVILRGVKVAVGRHRVTFQYETPGLGEGVLLGTGAALLLLLGLLLSRGAERRTIVSVAA